MHKLTRRGFAKKAAEYLALMGTAQVLGFPSIINSRRVLTKPFGPLCINWGHPLALGMSVCFTFNSPGGMGSTGLDIDRDLVQNIGTGNWNTASWAWVSGVPGPGVKITAVNTRLQAGQALAELHLRVPAKNCTILLVRRKTDATLRNSIVFGSNPGWTDTTKRCQASIPWSDGNAYWDWGGALAPNRLTAAGITVTTNVEYWAFRAGDWGSAMWQNGAKLANQTTAITRTGPNSGANSEFYLSGVAGGANTTDLMETYFFALTNQQWTDDMVNWWMAEPYAMLMTQSPRTKYFFGPAVPANKKPTIYVVT